MAAKKRLITSVTNKKDLEKFKVLVDAGWEIISTGGTKTYLEGFGIPVTPVEDVTDFPEMCDGRIKTLHPMIFGGLLPDRKNPKHMQQVKGHGIVNIDLAVVNLYDFSGNPGIEQIDVGGPSMLRAASKNGASIAAVIDPDDYDEVIEELLANGELSEKLRERLAIKVFLATSKYDTQIAAWMIAKQAAGEPIFAPIAAAAH